MFYATLPRLLSWKESDGFVIKLNAMNLESCIGIIQGVVLLDEVCVCDERLLYREVLFGVYDVRRRIHHVNACALSWRTCSK